MSLPLYLDEDAQDADLVRILRARGTERREMLPSGQQQVFINFSEE